MPINFQLHSDAADRPQKKIVTAKVIVVPLRPQKKIVVPFKTALNFNFIYCTFVFYLLDSPGIPWINLVTLGFQANPSSS
jgi:hypothetical protein